MAMENKRQIFLIIFAVVAGIAATLLTSNYVKNSIEQKTQELHDAYQQQQRQMAAEIQQRSEQQMASLQQEIARVRQEQQQAIQKAQEAMRAQQEMTQQAKTKRKSGALLTAKTPAGKRAVTVLIDSLSAVGGLLNAGDFVDVIAHLNVPQENKESAEQKGQEKKTITAMVFQDLQVLAINTNLDNPGEYDQQQSAPSLKITFAVDPQEAGLLAFANKNGKIELALRSANENEKQLVKASTWKTLADYVLQNQGSSFNVPEEAEIVKEEQEPEKPYIQIFRAGKEL